MHCLRVGSVASLSLLLLACGGSKPAENQADAKVEAKADADADAAKADAAKAAEAKAAEAKAAEKHFDPSHDKSGVLARAAAVLEADEALHYTELHELSHHTEDLPSVQAVCKHVTEIRGAQDALASCIKDTEHWLVKIGPEIYGEFAKCLMEAKTSLELSACEAAEHEIEIVLHEKPHGDGLTKEVCDAFFDHFKKLTVAEAGEQAELVAGILDEVRADLVVTCMDQGMKSEVECSMKATKVSELKTCSPMV